ncbi:MAG TPA: hypothetical protein VE981_23995 [Planctomycetota bacterium]|nr:hypothetical protein [Planctomycetota bacterium]
MEYRVGVGLGLGVCVLGALAGFDRDRSFYPVVTIVIASYYELFAVLGGSTRALLLESMVFLGFLAVSVVGFRRNLWLIVVALLAHGVMDFFHHPLIANPGVPAWWPMFCLTFDVAAGIFLAIRLRSARLSARAA